MITSESETRGMKLSVPSRRDASYRTCFLKVNGPLREGIPDPEKLLVIQDEIHIHIEYEVR